VNLAAAMVAAIDKHGYKITSTRRVFASLAMKRDKEVTSSQQTAICVTPGCYEVHGHQRVSQSE
jgi:hypothetical protein